LENQSSFKGLFFFIMRRSLILLLACATLVLSCNGRVIKIEPSQLQIVLSEEAPAPLRLATETLVKDFEKVTGVAPQIVSTIPEGAETPALIIIDRESDIYDLSAEQLKPLDNFESHRVWADPAKKRIYLDGFDMRGAIYAIYTFDEQFLGVPPLWFWCSWVPEHKDIVTVPANTDLFFKSPQVRYRAWLPNDTDLYSPWTMRDSSNSGMVLETMLRLKLNTFENAGLAIPGVSRGMLECKKYGIIVTSHHMFMLNLTFGNWAAYWTRIRGMKTVPELSLANESLLHEFWEYGAKTVKESGVENIWNIALRGNGDQPMWILFKDAPESEAERGEIITRLLAQQDEIIKQYTGEEDPVVRITLYDEMADLVNAGLVKLPSHSNMIWTFCSGRRDHYPYDDIQKFNPENPVHLGYYMNLQFTSTGSHLAPGEGPWKMEFNYRYVNGKSPLYLSVVNSGNFREFLYTMSANAKMLWDYESYDTDSWNREYAAQYFGNKYADKVAKLYHDYFYSYWTQRKSDFPGGMERQFIFHDNRHVRAMSYMAEKFGTEYTPDPLPDYYGYERVKGRVFRVIPEDNGVQTQVEAILKGMEGESAAFADIVSRGEKLMEKLPADKQQFFYDNLLCYAKYMYHLSNMLTHFTIAYMNQNDKELAAKELQLSYGEMQLACDVLYASQHGPFDEWYKPENKLGLKNALNTISGLINKLGE